MNNSNKVTPEFILKYYPNLIDDKLFNLFINEIEPVVRTRVDYTLQLYDYIIKFNNYKFKIVSLGQVINKNIFDDLLKEFKKSRSNIISILKDLGYSDNYFDHLIFNINKEMKKDILIESTVYDKINKESILNNDLYTDIVKFIFK